jgi:hypothetical protein
MPMQSQCQAHVRKRWVISFARPVFLPVLLSGTCRCNNILLSLVAGCRLRIGCGPRQHVMLPTDACPLEYGMMAGKFMHIQSANNDSAVDILNF